jgi:Carboxypeptidase regulatory-like domain
MDLHETEGLTSTMGLHPGAMRWSERNRTLWAACVGIGLMMPLATLPGQRGGLVLRVAVRDAASGEPVVGAEITVREGDRRARTDSLGQAVLAHLSDASGSISVRRLGYLSREVRFGSSGQDTVRLLIQLEPAAQPLPRAAVVDTEQLSRLPEFESRYGKRFGWFITEKEIRAALGSRLADLVITKIPGLRITENAGFSGHAYSTRGPRSLHGEFCWVEVYLDGVQVSDGEVNLVPLSLLGAVEYYPPGFVPVEYKRLGSAPSGRGGGGGQGGSAECGVLLLWTIH